MKTVLTQDQIDTLYRIFADFDEAAAEVNLRYSMAAGTALGAVRHSGLIPWDDDGDLYTTEESMRDSMIGLWRACMKRGLRIQIHSIDGAPAYGWYKIYANTETIPNVDLFSMTLDGDVWKLTNSTARSWWPKEQLPSDAFESMNRVPFGPLQLPLFHQPQDYLTRVYGHDWNVVAWDGYDHVNEKMRQPRSNARRIVSYDPALPTPSFRSLHF